jgi:hypothetical protein
MHSFVRYASYEQELTYLRPLSRLLPPGGSPMTNRRASLLPSTSDRMGTPAFLSPWPSWPSPHQSLQA